MKVTERRRCTHDDTRGISGVGRATAIRTQTHWRGRVSYSAFPSQTSSASLCFFLTALVAATSFTTAPGRYPSCSAAGPSAAFSSRLPTNSLSLLFLRPARFWATIQHQKKAQPLYSLLPSLVLPSPAPRALNHLHRPARLSVATSGPRSVGGARQHSLRSRCSGQTRQVPCLTCRSIGVACR